MFDNSANDRYDLAVKKGIKQAGRGGPGGGHAPPGGIHCAGVPSWRSDVAVCDFLLNWVRFDFDSLLLVPRR